MAKMMGREGIPYWADENDRSKRARKAHNKRARRTERRAWQAEARG